MREKGGLRKEDGEDKRGLRKKDEGSKDERKEGR
jgi:hypothetical protein